MVKEGMTHWHEKQMPLAGEDRWCLASIRRNVLDPGVTRIEHIH